MTRIRLIDALEEAHRLRERARGVYREANRIRREASKADELVRRLKASEVERAHSKKRGAK